MDAAARSGEFDPGCRACRGGIDRLFAARQQRSAPARSQPSAKESRESRLVTGLPVASIHAGLARWDAGAIHRTKRGGASSVTLPFAVVIAWVALTGRTLHPHQRRHGGAPRTSSRPPRRRSHRTCRGATVSDRPGSICSRGSRHQSACRQRPLSHCDAREQVCSDQALSSSPPLRVFAFGDASGTAGNGTRELQRDFR